MIVDGRQSRGAAQFIPAPFQASGSTMPANDIGIGCAQQLLQVATAEALFESGEREQVASGEMAKQPVMKHPWATITQP